METKVTFDVEVPDGTYTAQWKKYDIKFELEGKEIIGKCNVGLTNDYWDFCLLFVENNQGRVEQGI